MKPQKKEHVRVRIASAQDKRMSMFVLAKAGVEFRHSEALFAVGIYIHVCFWLPVARLVDATIITTYAVSWLFEG